ncbi:MAG: hypothetical protein EBX47_07410 [Synechococcaceae bacterium WB8_1B_057]|nr:hypothetical protein [Synechococcaceae bacterium WB6_1A_059]NDG79243.1 hypothetical protein [Synechococcaceae bacterium WB8_1B_057]
MAKLQIRQYVFTPGAIGVGTVQIPGNIRLEEILLITNVTRNTILYNFADANHINTTAVHSESNLSGLSPKLIERESGFTTVTLRVNTASFSSNDRLSILVENSVAYFKPWSFGTDAIERMRISQGQSMIDADFEYGTQPTKWAGYGLVRGYPGIYEVPGIDLFISSIITNGGTPSTITVTTTANHGMAAGEAVSILAVSDAINGSSRADGFFIIASVPAANQFTYIAWGVVGTNGQSLLTDATTLRRAKLYTGASLSVASVTSNGSSPSTITITFNSNHGLTPGSPLYVILNGPGNASNGTGPFIITGIPSLTSITYLGIGQVTAAGLGVTAVYSLAGFQIIHRPFDGGVIINCGIPSYGASVIRVSKKYFRYQSGKGLLWSTGTLLKPNYDIRAISQSGTSVGSNIFVTTDDILHGLQVGAQVRIEGFTASPEFDGLYQVTGINSDTQFQIQAQVALPPGGAVFGVRQKVVVETWHGATIRAGCFDDQNGMFWEFDGMNLCVVRRNAVQQLIGIVTVNPNSNQITGTNTRFTRQIKAGDKIVIRGMTHWVTGVGSDSVAYVNPDYRGTSAAVGVKASLIQETRSRQQEFNIDRVDGTGPSGFTINTARMHMLGIQYTWYGAGFVDWMVRGSDGNWVYVHRLKNNNVNYESHMRTGNLPVRYSIENEGAISWLTSGTSASDTSMWVADNTYFATTGTVYIDNELINYTGKSGSSILTGLTRAVPLTQWINGANYTMTAGAAAIHSIQTGVIQISNYATPTLSHWGSALLVDGLFDEDRGYIFNYQQSNLSITIATATVFLIRLAPSVSNSAVGDLGTRDLINRSTMLLSECAVSLAQGNNNPQSIIVEGVLNPKNVSGASWSSLNLETQGGQPSLGQVANSGQITYSAGTYALPGEQVFAFSCQPSGDSVLSLSQLKELTNSPFGGIGVFPNGPDTLAINVRVSNLTGNASVRGAVLLRWTEAQA